MDTVTALVQLMEETQLPCYKPETMRNLRSRFAPDMSDRAAAQFMLNNINVYVSTMQDCFVYCLSDDALCVARSVENFRTSLYDGFQALSQGIAY